MTTEWRSWTWGWLWAYSNTPGAVVETRDEVYAVTEAVHPKYMSFAPQVGPLQKGGADAAQVVKSVGNGRCGSGVDSEYT